MIDNTNYNNWHLIAKLTDESLLGVPGVSDSLCKYKVRAVLQNHSDFYALIYEERTGLYSFPGGSVEENEDILTALKREVREETGCSCDEIKELGYVYENRALCNLRQYSFFYTVKSKKPPEEVQFTDEEIKVGTKLVWCTLEEVIKLIGNGKPQTDQQKYLHARDQAALREYLLSNEEIE